MYFLSVVLMFSFWIKKPFSYSSIIDRGTETNTLALFSPSSWNIWLHITSLWRQSHWFRPEHFHHHQGKTLLESSRSASMEWDTVLTFIYMQDVVQLSSYLMLNCLHKLTSASSWVKAESSCQPVLKSF